MPPSRRTWEEFTAFQFYDFLIFSPDFYKEASPKQAPHALRCQSSSAGDPTGCNITDAFVCKCRSGRGLTWPIQACRGPARPHVPIHCWDQPTAPTTPGAFPSCSVVGISLPPSCSLLPGVFREARAWLKDGALQQTLP